MYEKITLKNGLRVIFAPIKGAQTTSILTLFKVGSRYETKKLSGASHFIEHLMFKGTEKRPSTLDITRELDGFGAHYNAFTAKDHTGYYVKINSKHTDLAFDILSDILRNSKFDKKEMEREKRVILEEINMYEDNPLMYIDDLLEEIMFKGNTLAWHIIGSKKSVKEMDRKEVLKYYKKFYSPKNFVLCVAGHVDEKVKKEMKKYFGEYKAGKYQPESFEEFRAGSEKSGKPKINLKYKETGQVQAALGFPAYSYSDPRIYPLYLLSAILGGNMSSRLFVSVREKEGLAYFIRSSLDLYEDTGALIIQAGLDKSRLAEALKIILKELKKIKEKGVSKEELKRAKDFIEGKTTLQLEDSIHVAEWFGKQELLTDEILTPQEKFDKIFAVKEKDIKEVAGDILKTAKINLALIGPFKSGEKFLKLLKI